MRIDVGELLRAPTGETRTYDIDEEEPAGAEGRAPGRVTGAASLLRTPAGILVAAHLALSASDACSRCLQEVGVALDIKFEEEFLPTVDAASGAALPPPEDPGSFVIDGEQVLDLAEAVRQYRETAMPMQPLCRPDCAGLCAACGRDLNLGPCGCQEESVDTRWSGLAKLGRRLKDL